MTASSQQWQKEFGIVADSNHFIATKDDLNRAEPQVSVAHVSRRAFDLLDLDGVLFTRTTPLVYFKQVAQIDNARIAALHRTFWNHGGAPILVIIAPDEVQIYSGFVRPVALAEGTQRIPAFVETIERASSALKTLLPAVASGEFLRKHSDSFDLAYRVDHDLLYNLRATREKLLCLSAGNTNESVLDALICRLVFACYLFDRSVIGDEYMAQLGLPKAAHLRDVLGISPAAKAKQCLYGLFEQLGTDFNGDLFSDDIEAEKDLVSDLHIRLLHEFFLATDVISGQRSFWPYDFSAIPIETISAIYEQFLSTSEQRKGSVYTPRFLAELMLDVALDTTPSLVNGRYLDPSCGSGIFLVGIFHRLVEEWTRANPEAPNERKARELRRMLCENIYGIDINQTACRITSFSLCLAYLDQLSPRDINQLRLRGHRLPKMVKAGGDGTKSSVDGNIWCGDFFADVEEYPTDVDVVVGNPPWADTADRDSVATEWWLANDPNLRIPDKQIAVAFVWKAVQHVKGSGRICFALPHGILFNRSSIAREFQQRLFEQHAVDHVINLADYQRFLFDHADHPAIVMCYRSGAPVEREHRIEYWAPKVDWLVTRSEVVTVAAEDRCTVTVGEVLADLRSADAPQIWKKRFWATPRDRRLIDRMMLYPRLRDRVRQVRERALGKRWTVSAGIQEVGPGDDAEESEVIGLPSRYFVDARSPMIDLFLLEEDCRMLPAAEYRVRLGSNKDTEVFRAPHVLVKEGFGGAAYADFNASFLFSLRGISGPREDRETLMFLAAYLSSDVARYLLFHTSSGWGVSRQRVGVDELLRLPFPLPEDLADTGRSGVIVRQVAKVVAEAAKEVSSSGCDRREVVEGARATTKGLLDEYFDILPFERQLIEDTVRMVIPSTRPTRKRQVIETIKPSTRAQRAAYTSRLSSTLNEWAREGGGVVGGATHASSELGLGVAILERGVRGREGPVYGVGDDELLVTLERLRRTVSAKTGTVELAKGIKIFDGNRLYIVKPIGRRFWTETAALNDADQIAGSILVDS